MISQQDFSFICWFIAWRERLLISLYVCRIEDDVMCGVAMTTSYTEGVENQLVTPKQVETS